jgi:chromosome segregation ATPase
MNTPKRLSAEQVEAELNNIERCSVSSELREHINALDEEIAELQKEHVSEMEEALKQHTRADENAEACEALSREIDRLRETCNELRARIAELESVNSRLQGIADCRYEHRSYNLCTKCGWIYKEINVTAKALLSPKDTQGKGCCCCSFDHPPCPVHSPMKKESK